MLGEGFGPYLADERPQMFGFAIGVSVIARLWWAHHRIFEHVVRRDRLLVVATIGWVFTIVLLAPVTAITTSNTSEEHPEVIAVHIGVMAVSSGLLTLLSRHPVRRPELTDGHDVEAGRRLFTSAETTVGFLLALVIGTLVPAIDDFALSVLALTGQVGRLVERCRRRRSLNIR